MSHRLLDINHWARSKRNFHLFFSPEVEIKGYRHFCFVLLLFHINTPSSYLLLHLLKVLAQEQKIKSTLKSSLLRQIQNRQFFWHYPCSYLSRKLNLLVTIRNSCSPGTTSESFCLEEWYHVASLKNPYTCK